MHQNCVIHLSVREKKITEDVMEQVTFCNRLTYFSMENSDANFTVSRDFPFSEKLSKNYFFFLSLDFFCNEKW